MQVGLAVSILFFFFQLQINKVLEGDVTSRLRTWSVAEPKVDDVFSDYRCNVPSLEILLSSFVGV